MVSEYMGIRSLVSNDGSLSFSKLRSLMDHLSARASGNRQRLPGIRLNADETGAGLDFVDQASVVIAHVIDSATDRSRN